MRIVCPNCASQYEVDDSAIPETGRDVQCAKCSEVWFQDPPMLLSPVAQPLSLETPEPQQAPEEQAEQSAPLAEPQPIPDAIEPSETEISVSQAYGELQRQQPQDEQSQDETAMATPAVEPEVEPQSEPEPQPAPTGMELPEVVEQPSEDIQTSTESPEQAPPAMFRSLRANRRPSEPVAQTAPPAEPIRQSISPDVKNILEQEANYSAQMRDGDTETEPKVETIDADAPSVDATPIDAPTAGFETSTSNAPYTKITAPTSYTELHPEPSDLKQQVQDIEAASLETTGSDLAQSLATPQADEVTLSSAKSLRDVLDSQESGDAVDQAREKFTNLTADVTNVTEPSLSDLGFNRAGVKSDLAATLAGEPASPEIMPQPELAATSSKSGKDVFTDIDEINSNIEIDADSAANRPAPMEALVSSDINAFKTGFYGAVAISLITFAMYILGPSISETIPATDGFVSAFRGSIDSGRMVLQDMYYGGAGEPGFDNLLNNLKTKI